MICLFHRNGKTLFWKWPQNHPFYPNPTIRCQKIENGLPHTNSKLLVNLTFRKTEHLIAQLRAGLQQKVPRPKTCPQGVLEAQKKNQKKIFLPLSSVLVWLEILHLSHKLPKAQLSKEMKTQNINKQCSNLQFFLIFS